MAHETARFITRCKTHKYQLWAMVTYPVVVKPCVIQPLPGEFFIGGNRAGAGGAEGEVLYAADQAAAATKEL
jgi:hypothetical protein